MKRPFSTLAGLILLAVAAAHFARLFLHLDIVVGGTALPMWVSYPGCAISALIGIFTLIEARR